MLAEIPKGGPFIGVGGGVPTFCLKIHNVWLWSLRVLSVM